MRQIESVIDIEQQAKAKNQIEGTVMEHMWSRSNKVQFCVRGWKRYGTF